MYCRGDVRRKRRLDELAAGLSDAERAPEQRLSGGGAETYQNVRADKFKFRLKPGHAGGDFHRRGLGVNAPLSARLELEVLDHVRDIGLFASDASSFERFIQHPAGRADERVPGQVLIVARLLPDEHEG